MPSVDAGPADAADATSSPLPVSTEPAAFANAPSDVERPLEDIIEDVLPAVVSIASSRGTGSGFFVDRYTVVTNYHVTGDDRNVEIKLRDGDVVSGRVERVSAEHDLALVSARQSLENHTGLPLARVEDVKVGQDVIVIGSPLGVLDSSVSRGIVSAIRPTESATLIQTDAAINPGNSGGPVIDRKGRVIGIATMKSTQGENLGFAVAADHARELLDGGGDRASGTAGAREPPSRLEDLTAEEHEPLLEQIVENYRQSLYALLQRTARCTELAPRLRDKRGDELYFEAGELVLDYVQQRRIYARDGRHIPEWSDMACLRRNEALVIECYEAIVVYDTAYKSYVSKSARRGRAPRVARQLPEI